MVWLRVFSCLAVTLGLLSARCLNDDFPFGSAFFVSSWHLLGCLLCPNISSLQAIVFFSVGIHLGPYLEPGISAQIVESSWRDP